MVVLPLFAEELYALLGGGERLTVRLRAACFLHALQKRCPGCA